MLSQWMYFWDEADWTGGVPPTPPDVAVDPGSGGGDYHGADDDYWKAREAFLKRNIPIEVDDAAPEVVSLAKEHNRIVEAVKVQPANIDFSFFAMAETKVSHLALQISQIESEFEEETLLAFLL